MFERKSVYYGSRIWVRQRMLVRRRKLDSQPNTDSDSDAYSNSNSNSDKDSDPNTYSDLNFEPGSDVVGYADLP